MPVTQGPTCACTWAAPARSKTVVGRSVESERRNIVKRVWSRQCVVGLLVLWIPKYEARGGKTVGGLRNRTINGQQGMERGWSTVVVSSFAFMVNNAVLCYISLMIRRQGMIVSRVLLRR